MSALCQKRTFINDHYRSDEIFFIEPDNLIIKEKRPIVRLQL